MKKPIIILAIAMLVALAACGGGTPKASNSPTQSTGGRPSSTGHITIVSPTPNEVIHGTTLHVKVTLTGARIVPRSTTTISPDTGHIHISIDGQIKSLYAGTEYDQPGLSKGRHLLQVEFVAADHGFFNPRVIETQTFIIE